MTTTKKLLQKYKNGNCQVAIYSDGTKIRTCRSENPQPEFPESIDLKITNRCRMNCGFCHESSTARGQHGDIEFIESILNDLPKGTEIAIGGGGVTECPFFVELLQLIKRIGLIANVTIKGIVSCNQANMFQQLLDHKLIYGLGVSISDFSELHMYEQMAKLPYNSDTVFHTTIGVTNPISVAKKARDKKILILGYKTFGRGVDYLKTAHQRISEWQFWIRTIMGVCKHVSFDNLALKQLDIQNIVSPAAWKKHYMGNDGEFTMYVDAVEKQFARSSTDTRFDARGISIKDMFSFVRKMK